MAERRHIETMIKKKEAEIQELESQTREAKIYLQALLDVLKRFPRETASDASAHTTLRAGSMVAKARDAILKAGRPLHVDEMLDADGKEHNRSNRTALGGSLSAYVRKGLIFTRVAPNTFGLFEVAGVEEASAENNDPPPEFGTEPGGGDDELDDLADDDFRF